MAIQSMKGKLISVIGDEVYRVPHGNTICLKGSDEGQDTCTGFLVGGIGEIDKHRQQNYMTVTKDTSAQEIEETFKSFLRRDDIAIILINQNIAELIRHVIDQHTSPVPAVLEIPSKECPYDASKDSILRRAKGMFSAEDFR